MIPDLHDPDVLLLLGVPVLHDLKPSLGGAGDAGLGSHGSGFASGQEILDDCLAAGFHAYAGFLSGVPGVLQEAVPLLGDLSHALRNRLNGDLELREP